MAIIDLQKVKAFIGGSVLGSLRGPTFRTAVNANYPAGAGRVAVTDTSLVRLITIPTALLVADEEFEVKDESGLSGTNNILVVGQTGTIDGAASISITANWGSVGLYTDGTDLFTRTTGV